jgi:ketosteroid isomerase-like protein
VGWAKYLQAYMRQREHVTNVRMDRSNSYVRVVGNFAWATYQWDFSANVDSTPTDARGQTTLIFQKREAHWLIVHNHTSIVGDAHARQATPAQPQPPKPGA